MSRGGGNIGFVRRSDAQFVVDGRPFFPIGTNSYYQMTYRRWNAPGPDEVLDKMQARGLNVVRTWAFQDAVECGAALLGAPARQLLAGERPINFVDPQTLAALDATLAAADARGVRVILTLVNNWSDYGGIDRWTLWRFGSLHHDAFFSDPVIRGWYKELATLLAGRVNAVNGRVYREDPTLFAWELANEPRCSPGAAHHFDAWIAEMSAHLKDVDPNHLVTTGIEGFFGPHERHRNTDGWMSRCGSDFTANHRHATIDFATCHIWPQNWGWNPLADTQTALSKVRRYLQQRLAVADTVLDKPLLCEEFGLPRDNLGRGLAGGGTRVRDLFFQEIYRDMCHVPASLGRACGGMLNWHILHDGYSQYDDGNGIFLPSDQSTDAILSAAAARNLA
jgi:mannan endo-1,4-beta-mannosidase